MASSVDVQYSTTTATIVDAEAGNGAHQSSRLRRTRGSEVKHYLWDLLTLSGGLIWFVQGIDEKSIGKLLVGCVFLLVAIAPWPPEAA